MGQFIDLTAKDGFTFPAYVAEPTGTPRGAVVVVPEIFGVNSHICSVADGYAADGYLAVAPSTFHRVKPGVELGYSDDDMKTGFGYKTAVEALPAPGVLQDLEAAIAYASKAGKVGIVGYCWGGLLVWRAAALLPGLAAARADGGHDFGRRRRVLGVVDGHRISLARGQQCGGGTYAAAATGNQQDFIHVHAPSAAPARLSRHY